MPAKQSGAVAQISGAPDSRLHELEAVIEQAELAYVKAGLALREIRDNKLYRQHHKTFEEYAKERWGLSRPTSYERIAAAEIAENVCSSRQIAPSFTQARTLIPLAPDQQRALASRVDFENITVRELREEVKKLATPRVIEIVPDSVTESEAVPAEFQLVLDVVKLIRAAPARDQLILDILERIVTIGFIWCSDDGFIAAYHRLNLVTAFHIRSDEDKDLNWGAYLDRHRENSDCDICDNPFLSRSQPGAPSES